MAYLLDCLAISKYLFHRTLEFAKIVLAKAVLVPANSLEEQILDAGYGHLEGLVPFWVQRLVDGRGCLARVSEVQD